jgi:hypothetical protein
MLGFLTASRIKKPATALIDLAAALIGFDTMVLDKGLFPTDFGSRAT